MLRQELVRWCKVVGEDQWVVADECVDRVTVEQDAIGGFDLDFGEFDS